MIVTIYLIRSELVCLITTTKPNLNGYEIVKQIEVDTLNIHI